MIKTAREVSPGGADPIGAAAALSDEEIAGRLDGLFRQKAAVEGSIVVLPGDLARRQAYRSEGATSTTNVTFTNVHHVVPWRPGGRTIGLAARRFRS